MYVFGCGEGCEMFVEVLWRGVFRMVVLLRKGDRNGEEKSNSCSVNSCGIFQIQTSISMHIIENRIITVD